MTDQEPMSRVEARALAQRERILAAAKTCFIQHGFHAASMANIAETAQMSPGLIYRYFASKNEIILAIIEQQLLLRQEDIAKLNGSDDIVMGILKSVSGPHDDDRMDPVLFLEMSAEASRDPQIANAVESSDLILRTQFCEWLALSPEQGGLGISAPRNKAVAFLLQCLLEGLQVREVREPELDLEVVKIALQMFLPTLLSPDSEAR